MIKINKTKRPKTDLKYSKGKEKGQSKWAVKTAELKKLYDQGQRSFDFKKKYTDYKLVKEELLIIQHQKCCYCEAKLYDKSKGTHQITGNVEHFRPKSAYIQDIDSNSEEKPAYYWLACDWDNLLFSCEACNQLPNKGTKFPLINPEQRAKNHHYSIEKEKPYLINPAMENPSEHITFRQEQIIGLTPRGEMTIKILGLDRLNEMRLEVFKDVDLLVQSIEIAGSHVPADLLEKLKKRLNYHRSAKAPFSAMFRANFAP
jgi:uncharacterized protein (TIGR02646 family)